MEDLAIGRQRNCASAFDRLLDLVASDLPRTRAQTDASVAIHAANMRSTHADDRVFNRSSGGILGSLDCSLNGRDCLVQFDDDTFARASRVGQAVPAVAQASFGELSHKRARLGTANINCSKKASLLIPHIYKFRTTKLNSPACQAKASSLPRSASDSLCSRRRTRTPPASSPLPSVPLREPPTSSVP